MHGMIAGGLNSCQLTRSWREYFHYQLNKNIYRLEAEKLQMDHDLIELQDRMKRQSELFYRIANLNVRDLSVEEVLFKAVEIIQAGWDNHDLISAVINYKDSVYSVQHFKETGWVLASGDAAVDEGSLLINVFYLDEQTFLKNILYRENDQNLINSITTQLASKIDSIISKKELNKKQELLDKTYKLARIGTWEFDMITHQLHWSSLTKDVHGFDDDYEPDLESTINLFKEGFNREKFAQTAYDAIEKEIPFDVELKIISGRGDERWIRAAGEPEYKNGVCTRFYGISQNVTGRKKAEEDIQLNEQRFKALVQHGSDLIAILDEDSTYKYVSPTSYRILGIPAEKFIDTNAMNYIHEEDRDQVINDITALLPNQILQLKPFRFTDLNGNWRWIETTITNMMHDPAVGGLVANSRDITERKLQQEKILESLKEKEILLAEIHHRVKNNLAVVASMMQIQAHTSDDKKLTDSLLECVLRIKSMANIHEHLYRSQHFAELDFTVNLMELVSSIISTMQYTTEINVEYACEKVLLNVSQAIPSSLIVNEVITNIIKHAFSGMEKGLVSVRISEKNNELFLEINDNGNGFPDDFEAENSTTLGFQLIKILSGQLEGEYSYYSNESGCTFTLQFRKEQSE